MLRVKNLQGSLPTGKEILKGVSLEINEGEIVALVGESGSGKSLTGLSLLGLGPLQLAGRARFEKTDLLSSDIDWPTVRAKQIAMIFQDAGMALNPVFQIQQQIANVLIRCHNYDKKIATSRAIELLGKVGIPQPELRGRLYPGKLSGGMKQRVMIAMALASGCKLLIADEPTTALDVTIQARIIGLLKKLNEDLKLTILFISHDLALVWQIADRVYVMKDGQTLENGATREVFASPRHNYTRELLAHANLGA